MLDEIQSTTHLKEAYCRGLAGLHPPALVGITINSVSRQKPCDPRRGPLCGPMRNCAPFDERGQPRIQAGRAERRVLVLKKIPHLSVPGISQTLVIAGPATGDAGRICRKPHRHSQGARRFVRDSSGRYYGG